MRRASSMRPGRHWLVAYKFKDWNVTAGRGTPVTNDMREARANEIAEALMNPQRWHSHGRGIPMVVLRDELRLQIDDFGAESSLRKLIHDYFAVLREFMEFSQQPLFVHTRSFF